MLPSSMLRCATGVICWASWRRRSGAVPRLAVRAARLGVILAGRRTVVAMAAAAGIADQFRRACWFFSGAAWDIDDLGLAVAG